MMKIVWADESGTPGTSVPRLLSAPKPDKRPLKTPMTVRKEPFINRPAQSKFEFSTKTQNGDLTIYYPVPPETYVATSFLHQLPLFSLGSVSRNRTKFWSRALSSTSPTHTYYSAGFFDSCMEKKRRSYSFQAQ